MKPIFWLSIALVAYVYVGYPLLLSVFALLFPRMIRKKPIEPTVSLLIPAFNEAAIVEQKIRNALALDYPPDKLEIVVASDGSTDGTADIAERMADGNRVRAVVYRANRGKLAVLNGTLPLLHSEIVVFSDASSMLAADSVRRLVQSFADSEVGAVSGVYAVREVEQTFTGFGESLYWRYETFLKVQEAALGSVLGCHGSLYAIRRSLYPYPERDIINDDYVIPMRILHRGFRIAYEPAAASIEDASEMAGFRRRVRVMTGNLRQLSDLPCLLWPPRRELFFLISHKLGRLLVPIALVMAFCSNLLLVATPVYQILALLQLLFYGFASAGMFCKLRPKILRVPHYFSSVNLAAFLAVYQVMRGRRIDWGDKSNTARNIGV
jgi:cellulose synthase/poly-beta-1,6-N-acetylglucosamine synthase-like glycosyltransferase